MHRLVIARLLLALLWLGAASALHAAAPTASVDRSVVDEGDSITLTIRVDATGSFDGPDYGVLQRDFDVFGSSESSQHVLNNGHFESWTEWQTTLMPKHSGELKIPALAIAGGTTQPLTIRVNPAGRSSAGSDENSGEPVFMEAQLDHQSVYVQQQLLLTVRVFHAIALDEMQLSEPSFDNASVRKVAETTFRREIQGAPYQVHELTYAIFPQQPGDLTIPELVFNAVQPITRRSLFDFPGQGRALRKMSRQLHASIKPIPKTFSGTVWLPAKNLTLSEHRSNSAGAADKTDKVAVGESITRNITLHADGLLAAQLPTLDAPKLDNAKLYNDQPTLDDQQDASGVHGKRVENMALIPNKAGDLKLPEMRVVWWDVDSDSEKVATLPAETLHIAAGAQSASDNSAAVTEPTTTPTSEAPTTAPDLSPTNITASITLRWWQAATALSTLTWLITLYFYWRLRHGAQQNAPITRETGNASTDNEENAFRQLKEACRGNNPAAARHALLVWAQQYYHRPHLQTLDQLLQLSNNGLLTREVQQLDNRLFGTRSESSAWNGENLLSVVRELRGKRAVHVDQSQQLPPLYPTA